MIGVKINPFTPDGVVDEVEVTIRFAISGKQRRTASQTDPGFQRVLARSVVNWEQAGRWPRLAGAQQDVLSGVRASDDLTRATQWYKVTLANSGLYQITGSQMAAAGISLSGLRSDSIRIFNGGGLPNEIDNSRPRPEFREVALLVIDGNDGSFDAGDRVMFYGEAVDRWILRDGFVASYLNNPYTSTNVYWLAVSGSFTDPAVRMTQEDGSPSGIVDTVITTCVQRVHVEQDRLISTDFSGHITDYYTWFWSDSNQLTVFATTPGAVDGETAELFLDGRTSGSGGTEGYIDVLVNGTTPSDKSCSRQSCSFTTTSLLGTGSLNRFDMVLQDVNPAKNVPSYFNYLRVTYEGRLTPVSNRGQFVIDRIDRAAEIQIQDSFSGVPTVFDISDPRRPIVVSGYAREGGVVRFHRQVPADSSMVVFCDVLTSALSPMSIIATDITDLRAIPGQTDLIVVTTRALADDFDEYIAYRSQSGVSIRVVAVEDVMDNFSYGLYDPTAIRDFLKYAYENYPSPAPSAALFVGDANYDYLDHLGTGVPNYVPSYVISSDAAYSDDNYVYFGTYGLLDSDTSYWGGGRGYDMMTARWPVRTTGELDAIVQKLMDYVSTQDLGPWRSRITLVADDEQGEFDDEIYHTTQTETLQREYIPAAFSRNKIYMWEYPLVNQEKPAVTDDILAAFNDGSLVINYVGHGNPDVWAHEHVLERGADLPRIHNTDRLPLVFAASCAIGFFDDPRREGMAEDFLVSPTGGAMGVVSATRLVYSGPNALLNQAVYSNLFSGEGLSVCEALYAAKLGRQYPDSIPRPVSNDRAYAFLGDPYVKLAIPKLTVAFTEYPDSLVALQPHRIAGRLLDAQGQPVTYDGTLSVTVFDAHRDKVLETDLATEAYTVEGPGIFRGSATISDGEFAFDFIPPLDVSYGRPGARVAAYAVCGTIDGMGSLDNIPVSRSLNPGTDSTGPVIAYGIVGRSNFVSGDVVTSADILEVALSDSSGINLADGIGHGIVLMVDGNADSPVNLTELFAYDQDDYTSGALQYPLSDLPAGEHRLKLTVWDNANNVSITEFTLEINATGALALNDLLNYPNPMGEATTFFFELTEPAERLNVEIFTVSGKRIWWHSEYGLGADRYPNGHVSIGWDGRDADGDRVATGVYIYKLSAMPRGGEAVEEFGKLVVLN